MRISLAWIKRILGRDALGLTPPELQAQLSSQVAEIEPEIASTGPALHGVVVGRVLTCAQHPNADRLRVTTVDIGQAEPVPIVCGAPNVAVGQWVAVATVGTTLNTTGPDGVAKSLTIKAAKLRGEASSGMICAEDELGLGSGHDGILVLSGEPAPGTPITAALKLGDAVLTLENACITHRPDLWGQLGWAREIAALANLPAPAEADISWVTDAGPCRAQLHDDGCLLYCGAVVEGVDNRESPVWLRDLLSSVGLRPLGLLIDVTNFVMLELGEPMHAFDLRQISGTTVNVRSAAAGEAFTTLDGKAHTLTTGDLLIADERQALALAGIMGGANSMVAADTTAVLLEAAIFKADRIRHTRIRTGVATDSSVRFEKSLYPELAPAALNRAIAILREVIPTCRVVQRFAAGDTATPTRSLPFDPALLRRLTGIDLPRERQAELLARLGFIVSGETVSVPWWRRKDVGVAVDLVEEIARSHGYAKILPETPRLPAAAPAVNALRAAEHRARRLLSALGWDEVATYAFTSTAWADALAWPSDTRIELKHPLSSEMTVLRQSLLPTLTEAVARNRKHAAQVAIYELGKRYAVGIGEGDTPDEELVLAGVCAAAGDDTPVYAARDAALATLRGLGYVADFAVMDGTQHELAAGRALDLLIDGQAFGVCGELPPALRTQAQAPERVGYFSIELERLVRRLGAPKPIPHTAPSRFPLVDLDFTWQCPEALAYADLVNATREAAGEWCVEVALVGVVYRGPPYPAGAKAVSLRLWLQADDRTLDDADKAKVQARVATAVAKRTGAVLRS